MERRVHTSGKDKSMLDPFRPERPDDVKRLKALQSQIHENFISHVKLQRGSKLSTEEDLFSGEIWIGKNAVEVGLVDGIGHLREILEIKLGNKIKINSFGPKRSIFHRFGTKILTDNIDQLQNRGLWARFGLYMIIKVISLFLIGMMVLAMFGKLRLPKIGIKKAKRCKKCGAHLIGKGTCTCGRGV